MGCYGIVFKTMSMCFILNYMSRTMLNDEAQFNFMHDLHYMVSQTLSNRSVDPSGIRSRPEDSRQLYLVVFYFSKYLFGVDVETVDNAPSAAFVPQHGDPYPGRRVWVYHGTRWMLGTLGELQNDGKWDVLMDDELYGPFKETVPNPSRIRYAMAEEQAKDEREVTLTERLTGIEKWLTTKGTATL